MVGQLWVILGRKGMGKTIFLTRDAVNSNREVWANYKINIDTFNPLSIADLLNLPINTGIYIDEAYTWLESRISGSVLNRYISYIIFQLRKTYCDMFLTAQKFSTLDLRVRLEADKIVKCKRKDNGVRPTDKLKDGKNELGIEVPYYYFWDYQYSILDTETWKTRTYVMSYENASKYFDLYDTREIIEPAYKEQMELELLKDNPSKLLDKCVDVADEIINDINEITRDTVRIALMKNGFSPAYEQFVYNILKEKVVV
jgi:GR25 family glycosyltransferase involved in LPS biosynthesis